MGVEVARAATPLGESAAAAQLRVELQLRGLYTPNTASLLLALVWIETARGSHLYNYNWGNLAAFQSWQGNYYRPPWYRVQADSPKPLQALHERMNQGEVPAAFRAYESHAKGLSGLLNLLQSPRYVPLLTAAKAGLPFAFADALNATGYSPDYAATTHGESFAKLIERFKIQGYFPANSTSTPSGLTANEPRPRKKTTSETLSILSLAVGAAGVLFALSRWLDHRQRDLLRWSAERRG